MGYRKQPFGYRMEQGEITVHPQEADTVRVIFRDYLSGMGFKCMAKKLNAQDVRYYPGKLWNKNMIARMLEDARYGGAKGYPPIVDSMELEAVSAIRGGRSAPCEVTPAQKTLRSLSGQKPSSRMEQTVLDQTNRLIADPALIQCPQPEDMPSTEPSELKARLDELLNDQPVDESEALPMIFRLAAIQYAAIGDGAYETERLRDIFSQAKPTTALDAALLKETVSNIRAVRDGAIEITLKNGQIIEGSNAT